MIVAGIGCRRGCPADDIIGLVRRAATPGMVPDIIAAPYFKNDEAGLHAAAARLDLPLVFIDAAALAAVQDRCVTRSPAAQRATGYGSVAEAAALAGGGTLILPRITGDGATCALVRR